jgi:hypothetical protein
VCATYLFVGQGLRPQNDNLLGRLLLRGDDTLERGLGNIIRRHERDTRRRPTAHNLATSSDGMHIARQQVF